MERVRKFRPRLVRKYISHGNKPLKVPPIPKNAPQPYTSWYHGKSNSIVIVLGTGNHTETGELLVHYVKNGRFWSRPLSMWSDKIKNGHLRFSLIQSDRKKK